MIIKELKLKNIGPFKDLEIYFPTERDKNDRLPVTIITGENGSGKTIILDAIRGVLGGVWNPVERDIVANKDFLIAADFIDESMNKEISITSKEKNSSGNFSTSNHSLNQLFGQKMEDKKTVDWVICYWTSKISNDSYNVTNIVSPHPENYLLDSLKGIQKNVEITQLICYFDYLKSSDDPSEKELGVFLFKTLKKMIKESLLNGEFKYVSRKTLSPIVSQNGQEISLEKLSSGNLFLIQRLVSLLGKMYSVSILNNKPIGTILQTKGLLMIDEAENHLHPKWQKTFINSVQQFFPNIQIILTTHSPFIVSSIENSKVLVCEPQVDHSIVVDRSDIYSNKPIDEILVTPIFDTHPFNKEISDLLQKRKIAIQTKDEVELTKLEKKLLKINPEYFSYIEIEKKIKEISK